MSEEPAQVPVDPPGPPAEPVLRSAHRDAGVHAVTVECVCRNVFTCHTDSDFVVCPNCKTKGRWRASAKPPPPGFGAVAYMRSARA